MSDNIVLGVDLDDYKYGFRDEENYVFKSRKGLDHEIVDAKSQNTRSVLGLNKSKKATRRRTPRKPTIKTTKKEPVDIDPTFTVIRDGRILQQTSPTGKTDDADSEKK